jgi:hypothetical protein
MRPCLKATSGTLSPPIFLWVVIWVICKMHYLMKVNSICSHYQSFILSQGWLQILYSLYLAGGLYCGGSASMVEKALDFHGDETLYVGDHIYTDVSMSKVHLRWRTALICRELEKEVILYKYSRFLLNVGLYSWVCWSHPCCKWFKYFWLCLNWFLGSEPQSPFCSKSSLGGYCTGNGISIWKRPQNKTYRAHESKRSGGRCIQSAQAGSPAAYSGSTSTGLQNFELC